MNFISASAQWAHNLFQHASLGDSRRVKRLITLSATLAAHTVKSVPQANQSDAHIEAAYRFIRNDSISANAIAEVGFMATKQAALAFNTLLAREDSSFLNFFHKGVNDELGHITSYQSSRGFQAHTMLLYALIEKQVVSLIKQTLWTSRGLNNKATI